MEKEKNNVNWTAIIITIIIGAVVLAIVYSAGNANNNQTPVDTSAQSLQPEAQTSPATKAQNPKIITQAPPIINYELSENPNYLFSKNFDPKKVKVYGVGIGDLGSQIDYSTIKQQEEFFGWVHTTNGIGYRIADGRVVEIALNDLVKRIGLIREDEIIMRFGEPDQTKVTGSSPYITDKYYYISRGLIVSYSTLGTGGVMLGVNIISNQ